MYADIYVIYATAASVFAYVIPHMVHTAVTNSILQKGYRYPFLGGVYEAVLSWYILIPTTVALIFPHYGKFNVTAKGGTMRLGAYPCTLKKGSNVAAAYGKLHISERHRHRYEFNNDYMAAFEGAGMQAVGINPDTGLVEVVEVEGHPWFVGTQYHPEYKSTVLNPSPLFVAFVGAALEYAGKK